MSDLERERKVLKNKKLRKVSVQEKVVLGKLLDKEFSSRGWGCNAIQGRETKL